jgi:hypothetical protein
LLIRDGAGLLPTPNETVMIHRLAVTPAFSLDDSLSVEWREGEVW